MSLSVGKERKNARKSEGLFFFLVNNSEGSLVKRKEREKMKDRCKSQ